MKVATIRRIFFWYIFYNPFKPVYIHQFVFLSFFVCLLLAQGYFTKKSFARIIFKCVYLSLFIITKLFLKSESLLLFKLNKLMVAVAKNSPPANTNPVEYSLKYIYMYNIPLSRSTFKLFLIPPRRSIIKRIYQWTSLYCRSTRGTQFIRISIVIWIWSL